MIRDAAYSQDIEADLPQPPSHSREAKARTIATCAHGLQNWLGMQIKPYYDGLYVQHDSQQLLMFPIVPREDVL